MISPKKILVKFICICYLSFMEKTNSIVAKAYAKRDKEIGRLYKAKWTLREIGAMFGLSYERVRQILNTQKVGGAK